MAPLAGRVGEQHLGRASRPEKRLFHCLQTQQLTGLVHAGAIITMRTPPTLPGVLSMTAERPKAEIRLTIPVSADVHEAFSRIAAAANMPVGRAMGEWLGDTLDAARFMADTMEKARAAPKLVAQELHAYALGMGDEAAALLKKLREDGRAGGGHGDGAATARPTAARPTPPSNTGVTTTKKKTRKGGIDGKNQR